MGVVFVDTLWFNGVMTTTTSTSTSTSPEPRQCADCGVWTFNADHTCLGYGGPPCAICGAPTLHFTYGAPGIGGGDQCRQGHITNDTGRILTLDECR